MRIFILLLFCIAFHSNTAFSQFSNDPKKDEILKELIEIKKELTNDDQLKEFYKIQLYSGNLKDAEKVKKDFDKAFDLSSTIKYETPNYKVWIGNFRNRLEADRALVKIEEVFNTAFIIKPGR